MAFLSLAFYRPFPHGLLCYSIPSLPLFCSFTCPFLFLLHFPFLLVLFLRESHCSPTFAMLAEASARSKAHVLCPRWSAGNRPSQGRREFCRTAGSEESFEEGLAEEHHQREKQRDRNLEQKSDAGLLWEVLGRHGDPCFLGIKVKQEQEVV